MLQDSPEPARSTTDLGARLRNVKTHAALLVPGALALFGFQILGLLRSGSSGMGLTQHAVLLAGAIWATAGLVLLSLVLVRRPPAAQEGSRLVQALGWTVGLSTLALLLGAFADILLAVQFVTGSWTTGAIAVGLLTAVAALVCW
jgi:hypothetical protein